ncbi:Transketolase, thiamine diphosphate binding domain-containing protein [Dipodascopsis tothii]|uniref:Transketolase, thiamine diphosphate binding domain-containing protein n=1 Tax=Dipodascopsis tothii TaxID=44089 RepID=UPI0034CD5C3A
MELSDSVQARVIDEIKDLALTVFESQGGRPQECPIGVIPIAIVLIRYVLRHSPGTPTWFDRDRFLMCNPNSGIVLHCLLHAAGYGGYTLEHIWNLYTSNGCNHSFPQVEYDGKNSRNSCIAGQSVANAVGLAMAGRHLASKFNRQTDAIINSQIFVSVSESCLQEGTTLEALTLAATLKLDNLTIIFDNENDKKTARSTSVYEHVTSFVPAGINEHLRAIGYHVIDVFDCPVSLDSILAALKAARAYVGKPTFVNVRTAAWWAGDNDPRVTPITVTRVPGRPVALAPEVYSYFHDSNQRGAVNYQRWTDQVAVYAKLYPKLHRALCARMQGAEDIASVLDQIPVDSKLEYFDVLRYLAQNSSSTFFGTTSSLIAATMSDSWQMPEFQAKAYDGRLADYGSRELAMIAIHNGMAAYSKGAFLPITVAPYNTYLFASAALHTGAREELSVAHVAIKESATSSDMAMSFRKPQELDALMHAIPNLIYVRPFDREEIVGALKAITAIDGRQLLISIANTFQTRSCCSYTERQNVKFGAYVVLAQKEPRIAILSCGLQLPDAYSAGQLLNANGVPTRVISVPSLDLFDQQSETFKKSIFSTATYIISVDTTNSSLAWSKYCHATVEMDPIDDRASHMQNLGRSGQQIFDRVKMYVDTDPTVKWMRI